jgi:hypothetical protein
LQKLVKRSQAWPPSCLSVLGHISNIHQLRELKAKTAVG